MAVLNDWKKSYFAKLDNEDVALYLEDYSSFKEDPEIPSKAKRVMASMLCVYDNTKATETGICFMDLNTLKRISGCSVAILKRYAEWLKQKDLLDIKLGSQRSSGVSGQATGFTIKFDNLQNWDTSKNVNALHNISEQNNLLKNKTYNNNLEKNTEDKNNITNDILEHETEQHDNANQHNALQVISEQNTGILSNKQQENSSDITEEYVEEYGKPYPDDVLLGFDDELFVEVYSKILLRDKGRMFSSKVVDRFQNLLKTQPEFVRLHLG